MLLFSLSFFLSPSLSIVSKGRTFIHPDMYPPGHLPTWTFTHWTFTHLDIYPPRHLVIYPSRHLPIFFFFFFFKYQILLSENFQILEVKFSVYLNRCVFIMTTFQIYKTRRVGGGVWGEREAYIWPSMHVHAKWPPFSALPGI